MTYIDTAAIRDFLGTSDHITFTREMVLAVCTALDAARAELSDQERWTDRANANTLEQRLRAEEAEARHEIDVRYIAKIEARMERAEARIAEMEQDYRAERDRQETAANHTQRQRDHFRD